MLNSLVVSEKCVPALWCCSNESTQQVTLHQPLGLSIVHPPVEAATGELILGEVKKTSWNNTS